VFLVGAGPGDPDLLTVKALRLIHKADVLVYDRLIPKGTVARARPGTELVYVGKAPGAHTKTQEEINALLIDRARKGLCVCRLKGGDPFIFGRGGEEMEALQAAGIPVHVVPGITAATGCACAAGIPLTHRDHAQSVRFVTGHLKAESAGLDWSDLAKPHQTVVFYMALGQLEDTCARLLLHGVPPDRPVAIVSEGTLDSQRICVATVATIFKAATEQHLRPPSLLIIGDVVALRRTNGSSLLPDDASARGPDHP
jgi:uroporphyrin-III C-methyltransferase